MNGETKKWSFNITTARVILILIALVGIFGIAYRYIFGLGAATNLSDDWPWGLWIGFDVMLGVALAGGGYGTALIIHILHKDRFYPIARSAMLTSLLGYLLVVAGVFLDIGRYFNFWAPFVSPGYHSVMFEVFLCIFLYTVVQLLEFGEIFTEKVWKKWHGFFVKIMPFLLVLGVLLPTLHQASLGGLYLTQVGKLHDLWYSPLLPLYFLISSFFVGPAMVAIESALSGRAFKHEMDLPVIQSLMKIAGGAIILYLVIKFIDLAVNGNIGLLFNGSFESMMMWLEMGVGMIVPLALIFTSATKSKGGLIFIGGLVVFGVIMSRMNVVFTGMAGYTEGSYFPSWMEIAVSLGLVSIGVLIFLFVTENFNILRHKGDKVVSAEN